MIRTKGEAGTGNVVEAVRHMRAVRGGIRRIAAMSEDELMAEAKHLGAPFDLVQEIHATGKLPVVNFSAGGIATPADAALMMQLGCDGNFVGSGIFKSNDPLGVREGDRRGDDLLRQARGHRRGERRARARRCPVSMLRRCRPGSCSQPEVGETAHASPGAYTNQVRMTRSLPRQGRSLRVR